MKSLVVLLILGSVILDTTSARIIFRHRRQVERESDAPAAEVVVIKDTNGTFPPGPQYDFIPNSNDSNVFDLDINENDGTFNFGGHLPHFHNFHHMHRTFNQIFESIQKRFEGKLSTQLLTLSEYESMNTYVCFLCKIFTEMTRNMMSFDTSSPFNPGFSNGFNHGFGPSTDVASIPDNTNDTVTEIVTFNGRRYLKKTTTVKKGGPGSMLFIRSTTFEPVNDSDNDDTETGESPSKPSTPDVPLPGEPIETSESSQESKRVKDVETSSTSSSGLEREEMTSPASSS